MRAESNKLTSALILNTGAEIPAVGLSTRKAQAAEVYEAAAAAARADYRDIDTPAFWLNKSDIGSESFISTKLCVLNTVPQKGLWRGLWKGWVQTTLIYI